MSKTATNSRNMSLEFPDELKNKAREYFKTAAEKAYSLNYDYAIDMYLYGITFWPEAVEEGHMKLREVAMRRALDGGKKSGFGDGSKYKKASGKIPKDAMLKAEYLLSKDPKNTSHMADMLKACANGDFKETGKWIGDILFGMHIENPKASANDYHFLLKQYEKLGYYTTALKACQMALQKKKDDKNLQELLNELTVKSTMEQGNYEGDGDFRESIKDAEEQSKLQSQENIVKSEEVVADMIQTAREEYEKNPNVPGKINAYVDILVETDDPENELEAIKILDEAFENLDQFRFKQRSNETKMKQHNRRLRNLRARIKQNPDDKDLKVKYKEADKRLLATEIDHYLLCADNYPTEMIYKYELACRYFKAQKYEDAIPLFQQSRGDIKFRARSNDYIGRCFYHTEWYPEAISSFSDALEAAEDKEGDFAKKLMYNLGRAYEADGKIPEALEQYRKVAQIDFNYFDVRTRVDALRKKSKDSE